MEDIRNDIWADPDFEELEGTAKLVYIWSWTNPRCGMAGVYTVSHRAIAAECGLDVEAAKGALERLTAGRFVEYVDGWLWVRTRVKHLRQKGAKMAASVARDLDKLPTAHPLRGAFFDEYRHEPMSDRDGPWLVDALAERGIEGGPNGADSASQSQGKAHGRPFDTPSDTPSIPHGQPIDGLHRTGTRDRDRETTSSQGEAEVDTRARTRSKTAAQDVLPTNFPEELTAVAERVLAKLSAMFEERGGNTPTLRGVGLAIAAHPDRDHEGVAGNLEHWAIAGNGQSKGIKDWAGTYRNFLSSSPPAAPTRTPAAAERPSLNHLLKGAENG